MLRWLEFILGLERGFLSRQGEFVVRFNCPWPDWDYFPPALANLLLGSLLIALVLWVYHRENAPRKRRILLASLRMALLGLLLALLNRPMATLVDTRAEASVLAVLIDDSASMAVPDIPTAGGDNVSRLNAVQRLLDAPLLQELAARHTLRFYHFSSSSQPLPLPASTQPAISPSEGAAAAAAIAALRPDGQNTRLAASVRQVAQELQGQRVAGIVVLSDGRDVPPAAAIDLSPLAASSMRLFAIPVGSEKPLRNIAITRAAMQEVVFQGDLASIHLQLTASGIQPGEKTTVSVKDARTGETLSGDNAQPAQREFALATGEIETDIAFKAENIGPQDVLVEVKAIPGELTAEDNARRLQASVLDARIAVLYVEGYPRWEYRYLRNQLTRDKTIDISCLLTSADPGFAQEGDKPIRYFPQTLDQLLEYDVVLLGDVDPRNFSDAAMQMLQEFVMKKGGGLAMIAGPRWSPQAYRNTPIETLLPVDISATRTAPSMSPFRPVITPEGEASPIFRFFGDTEVNRKYIRDDLPPLYWFAAGATVRSGVGEVLAEHPTELASDGHKAPLLVAGRPGAGRSLYSAIDESWRWRYYTGESVFDTYWVQQVRYLARGRKVGQRRISLASVRNVYELGEQTRLNLRVLDDSLAASLPDTVSAEILDATGRLLQTAPLTRQPGQRDLFSVALPAQHVGHFTARLPSIAPNVDAAEIPFEVISPRLELSDVRLARPALAQLAAETDGRVVELPDARRQLLSIPSAGRLVPIATARPIWSSPILLALLATLLATEWLLRKLAGLL